MNQNEQGAEDIPEEEMDALCEHLLLLRSDDAGERVQAFNYLGPLPVKWLELGYERFRRVTPAPGFEMDCLERLEVELPLTPIVCDRCICAVVSPGYETMLEVMLETLQRYGESSDACIVIFAVDESYEALVRREDIICIRCRSVERVSPAVKGVIYSASRFIQARTILAVETDMLVVGSLQPLWTALESIDPTAIAGVRPPGDQDQDMTSVLAGMGAPPIDLEFLTGQPDFNCRRLFNGGTIAGGREAFTLLDQQIRLLCPRAILWVEGGSAAPYTDECLMNLCLGLSDNAVCLHRSFNQQFYSTERERWLRTEKDASGLRFWTEGVPSRILHFVGPSRALLWQIKAEIDVYGIAPIEPAVIGADTVCKKC